MHMGNSGMVRYRWFSAGVLSTLLRNIALCKFVLEVQSANESHIVFKFLQQHISRTQKANIWLDDKMFSNWDARKEKYPRGGRGAYPKHAAVEGFPFEWKSEVCLKHICGEGAGKISCKTQLHKKPFETTKAHVRLWIDTESAHRTYPRLDANKRHVTDVHTHANG